jgi:hypothetical protein
VVMWCRVAGVEWTGSAKTDGGAKEGGWGACCSGWRLLGCGLSNCLCTCVADVVRCLVGFEGRAALG